MSATQQADLELVRDPARATTLLHPLRRSILDRARTPTSSSRLAEHLGQPRQKLNYHVRELARRGFLLEAGRRNRRNLTEQRWIASARSYLLSPEVLDALAADWRSVADRESAAHLLALTSQVQADVARVAARAAEEGRRVATWSLHAEIGFDHPERRAAFARDLEEAVARVVAEHTVAADGEGARPFRLVVGCHPIPVTENEPERSRP